MWLKKTPNVLIKASITSLCSSSWPDNSQVWARCYLIELDFTQREDASDSMKITKPNGAFLNEFLRQQLTTAWNHNTFITTQRLTKKEEKSHWITLVFLFRDCLTLHWISESKPSDSFPSSHTSGPCSMQTFAVIDANISHRKHTKETRSYSRIQEFPFKRLISVCTVKIACGRIQMRDGVSSQHAARHWTSVEKEQRKKRPLRPKLLMVTHQHDCHTSVK